MHNQMVKKQQVEYGIRIKITSSKYAMQLQPKNKSMRAPWENIQNNIENNMRFQRNIMVGMTGLLSLRNTSSWAPK
jgi:hypothetical protein